MQTIIILIQGQYSITAKKVETISDELGRVTHLGYWLIHNAGRGCIVEFGDFPSFLLNFIESPGATMKKHKLL